MSTCSSTGMRQFSEAIRGCAGVLKPAVPSAGLMHQIKKAIGACPGVCERRTGVLACATLTLSPLNTCGHIHMRAWRRHRHAASAALTQMECVCVEV